MRRYLAARSVRALIVELAANCIATKRQRLRDGRIEAARDAAVRCDKLVAALVRGHQARERLRSASTLIGTALTELRRAARLCYLAPDIIDAIPDGRQPRSLTSRMLSRVPDFPVC